MPTKIKSPLPVDLSGYLFQDFCSIKMLIPGFFFLHWFFFGFLELTGSNLGTFTATIISNIHSEIFFYVFLLLVQLDVYFKQLFHSCWYFDIFNLLLSIYFR